MANYYVAPIAGSGGSGTIGAPWKLDDLYTTTTSTYTPGVALTTLQPGDTLYFRNGTYSLPSNLTSGGPPNLGALICPTHSGVLNNPITLQPYPGESVTLNSPGVLDAGYPGGYVIGSNRSYIRIIGFTVNSGPSPSTTAIAISGDSFYPPNAIGNEVGYCKVVCEDLGAYGDNHQCIYLSRHEDTWIHHCELTGATQSGNPSNAAGLKVYQGINLVCEDNYIHDNSAGIFQKDNGNLVTNNIYRRNLITANVGQFLGPGFLGAADRYYIYDNVIDGYLPLVANTISDGSVYTDGVEVYNNLFRTSDSGSFGIRGITNQSSLSIRDNIWNNITIGANGSQLQAYQNQEASAVFGGGSPTFAYLDYNVWDGPPVYDFALISHPWTDYNLAAIQANGLEQHAKVDSAANIFVDQIAYVLKGIYPTAGRGGIYASFVGPGVSTVPGEANPITTAEILDTSRYGPSAMLPQPDVLMMAPFTDTLGVLVIVPLYLNPATTIGGPTLPTAVNTPPTWLKNGSPIVFDLVTFDAEIRAIVYQYPSWGALLATDVLTMSAPQEWATTVGGDLGGTGIGGTSSTPVLVLNNVGRAVETQYDTASRTMQIGVNAPGFNALGQPRVNWCSRLAPFGWTGVVSSFDATTDLPTAIGGAGVSCFIFRTGSNGVDSRGYPMAQGRWRLTYGDASPGVDATHHKLLVQLIGNTGWVETIISAGTFSGGAWHDIITEYVWTDPGTNTPSYIRLDLYSTAAGGAVVFPDKGNGQVELCVTGPSAADPNVADVASYDPLGICSQYLAQHQALRSRAIRWMNSNSEADVGGDSMPVYVADLLLRQKDDFSWANQTPFPSTTVNIIKVEPVTTWNAIIPYLGTTNTMTLANYGDFSNNVLMLCTTDVDHELYSGFQLGIFPTTTAPNPVIDTGLTLSVNITTTTGPTTITISDTTGLSGTFVQIGSEQMTVVSVNSSTSLTVSRGSNGTTGATHTAGVTVYPGVSVTNTGGYAWVTGVRTFVIARLVFATTPNVTIVSEVDYTPPNCPSFDFAAPPNTGSNPYEMQAKIVNAVATANNTETILWTNFPFMVTDALITEVVQNQIAPQITSPHVTFIFELSNELWNFQFHQSGAAFTLYRTAPNPETSGTGFPDQRSFIVSRQNHINTVAKAAAVAGGISAARVYNFQPGKANNTFTQSEILGSLVYAQAHDIPIDYMSMGGYMGLVPQNWTQFWDWMPIADGGNAPWSRAYARQVAMSYMRAYFWFSPLMGVAVTGAAQAMSWYQAGKSVANAGVGSATANSGLGRLCGYEVATEIDATTDGDFTNPIAMEHDWIADPNWLVTETAYFAAMQSAPDMYRALMPAASFPVAVDMDFVNYFALVSIASNVGEGDGEALYDLYDFQGQPHGPGLSNVMGWSATTPTFEAWQNESVRAQAIFEWNALPVPATSGGKSSNFAILMAGM